MAAPYKSIPPQLKLGEKPYWSNGNLYYVDLLTGAIYRYAYCEDKLYTATIAGNQTTSGFIVPFKNNANQFIVGLDNVATVISWDGVSSTATQVRTLFTGRSQTTLNGLLVSPQNDLYSGNLDTVNYCGASPKQQVYQYLRDQTFAEVANNMGSTAGMVLIEKTNTVYQIDGCLKALNAFTWNPLTGELCKDIDKFRRTILLLLLMR